MLIAPLMPGINDSPEQVRDVVRQATEAGADYITGIALHLRRGVRDVFMEWLAEYRPELVPQYEKLYKRGAYMPPDERRRLAQLLQGPARQADDSAPVRYACGLRWPVGRSEAPRSTEAGQQSLF